MAYFALGLSDAELAERFNEEAPQLSEAEIAARFGRPRYSKDGPDYSFLRPNALRSYHELPHPQWKDEQGREYTLAEGNMAYVRLPISETRRERTENVPIAQRQQFPRPRERVVLRSKEGEEIVFNVASVLSHKVATALVAFDEALPRPEKKVGGGDEDAAIRKRLKRLAAEAEKLGLPEGSVAASARSAQTDVAKKSERRSFSAPKAPKAPRR